MNLVKEAVSINETAYRDFSEVVIDGDIIVPDVKPDILKVLQVDALSAITGKQLQNGRMNISGKVDLKILYIPDRADEPVKSIITSLDFSHKIDNNMLDESMQAFVECDVSRVDFSLLNSRKLNVKAVVALESNVVCSRNIDLVTDVNSDTYAEINKSPFEIYNVLANSEEEFAVKDCIEVMSGKMSIRDILKIDYSISDKEFKTVTGKVVGKGVVNACILYVGENGNIEFMETDIPFTEVFSAEGVTEESDCEVCYSITDMFYEVCEDSDGDRRIINIEFLINAQIKVYNNFNIDIVNDFYCPGLETKITRDMCSLNTIAHRTGTQNTIREIIPLEGNLPPIMGVYNVITKAYVTKNAIENNKMVVEGVIDCYILYLADNTDSPVFSYKKEVPFSYMLDAPGCTQDMHCEVNAEIEHSSYSLNMANEVELRCILSLDAKVFEAKSVEVISDAEIYEITDDRKLGIVIYFVQKGDSIWKIAKRYKVAMEDIIKMNNLDPEAVLRVGQQLIIPVSRKKSA